jgi:1-acyl-sn-glycerol-3-phosphate acyltransferase
VRHPSLLSPWRRRSVSIGVVLAAFTVAVAFAPLIFALAALADVVTAPRAWRNTRLAALAVWALAIELCGLLMAGLLWIRFGCGASLRSETSLRAHHRLQRWYTGALLSAARVTCNLRIEVDDPAPAAAGNAIVIGRHTSIGDALIPAVLLADGFDINTRYVLKDDLLWGPAFDLVGNRLINHFVDRAPDDTAGELRAISRLAHGLGPRSVVVIFPEGTFYSAARHVRAIERLAASDRPDLAPRAQALRHLLPPRPGGTLALLDAAPQADVVVIGNIGFERFTSLGAIYRNVPFRQIVEVWLWRVPNCDIPRERNARLDWLYDQWARLDESIDKRTPRAR